MKTDKLTLTIIASVVAIGLIGVYLLIKLPGIGITLPKIGGNRVSSDILHLTSPVNSISGKVEKISGRILTISQVVDGSKKLNFTITVPEETGIIKNLPAIPYLFKDSTVSSLIPTNNIPLEQLLAGENVTINTVEDLRQTNPHQLTATGITVTIGSSSIIGTITAINGDKLTVKAAIPSSQGATIGSIESTTTEEVDYLVTVSPETEISQETVSLDPTKPNIKELLTSANLAVNQNVIVYSNLDTTSNFQFTALLIQPTAP